MSNATLNVNGGSGALSMANALPMSDEEFSEPSEREENSSNQAHASPAAPAPFSGGMPTTEEEADAMLSAQMGNDPNAIRAYAKAVFAKLNTLADKHEPTVNHSISNPTYGTPQPVASGESSEPSDQLPSTSTPQQANQGVVPPMGYQLMPEGAYRWAPDIWNGKPLHFVPDHIDVREHTILVYGILLAPSPARSRTGRIVQLPEGAKIVFSASVAWDPMIPLTKGPLGRPVMFAAPTTVDKITMKTRAAGAGDEILRFPNGDGGMEYGIIIWFDPDPRDPTKARLITLETLRGARR